MSDLNYPLRFKPIPVEKIWGGKYLTEKLNKPFSDKVKIGESWEISAVPGKISIVQNGSLVGKSLTELINNYKEDLLGKVVYSKFNSEFPLLIKFLDARKDLSIQVHPNDNLARKKGFQFGKSEMWFILDAEHNSQLIRGFNKNVERNEFEKALQSNSANALYKYLSVSKNDTFYIPAGTLHNIGKGIVLAEIQQSSDITYRVDDFGRKDSDGNLRELHIEESLEAIDFKKNSDTSIKHDEKAKIQDLVKSDYFYTKLLQSKNSLFLNYSGSKSFKVLICVSGKGRIEGDFNTEFFSVGDTFLIPSRVENLQLNTDFSFKMLETQII